LYTLYNTFSICQDSDRWRFPKISYSFSQDGELEGNSKDEKVEKDFLRDKARYFT